MTSLILNIDQTTEELNDIYGERDYYWYLESPEFRQAFLRPLGDTVNKLTGSCLDVACGRGWLSDYVSISYIGIDGSETAIMQAKGRYPNRTFYVARFEKPKIVEKEFRTIVFGGVFSVLVKPEYYIELLEQYQKRFYPKYFVIYDLQRLNTSSFSKRYALKSQYKASAKVQGIPDVKNHRKILVYQCS